ncbi:MAG: serine hydrolase [Candidatus Falkowbacteria bacterium]
MTKKKLIILVFLTAAVMFLAGWFIRGFLFKNPSAEKAVLPEEKAVYELRAGGYEYINPLLECEIMGDTEITPLKELKAKINTLIEGRKKQGHIEKAAVYYRDLVNGPWMGIEEREKFNPASLLKIPMLIAFLKLSEEYPGIMERQVTYSGEFASTTNLYDPATTLIAGEVYTIYDLIYKMIVYSDNTSKDLLKKYLNTEVSGEYLTKIAADIDLIMPTEEDENNRVSAKSYASMFRVLFNASFLSRGNSEKALALLAESTYKNGLKAGLPPETAIAHKFGHYGGEDISQLHDCGIIYTDKPYILCIMTLFKNEKIEQAEKLIGEISGMVYGHLNTGK